MTFSSSGFTTGGFDITDLGGGRSFTAGAGSDKPELGSITIRFPGLGTSSGTLGAPNGIEIDKFLSYEYHEDYLVPVDAGSFTVSGDQLTDADFKAIIPGARVEVSIDGQPQSAGFLDDIRIRSGRSGGTILTFEYRSWLSPAVDAQVDPQTRFAPSMSLLDLVQATLEPFGVKVFSTDNDANRNSITGRIYGTPTSKKKGIPLKSFILHSQKPYDNEGAFAFAGRVSQRFGLWIRPGVEEGTVIIGEPDFDQDPRYALHHKLDDTSGLNNVLESEVVRSRKDQPSIIFASGFGGGSDFAKATLKGMIINPLIVGTELATSLGLNQPITDAYPTVKPVLPSSALINAAVASFPIPDVNARALYLKDSEAHNQDELDAFLRRELSLRMRKALTAHYTIEGHKLGGQPIAVDSIVSVDDDRSGIRQGLWVQARRFSKSAGSTGTTTQIDAILPGTLIFGSSK